MIFSCPLFADSFIPLWQAWQMVCVFRRNVGQVVRWYSATFVRRCKDINISFSCCHLLEWSVWLCERFCLDKCFWEGMSVRILAPVRVRVNVADRVLVPSCRNPCRKIESFFCKDCCFGSKTLVLSRYLKFSHKKTPFLLQDIIRAYTFDSHRWG